MCILFCWQCLWCQVLITFSLLISSGTPFCAGTGSAHSYRFTTENPELAIPSPSNCCQATLCHFSAAYPPLPCACHSRSTVRQAHHSPHFGSSSYHSSQCHCSQPEWRGRKCPHERPGNMQPNQHWLQRRREEKRKGNWLLLLERSSLIKQGLGLSFKIINTRLVFILCVSTQK